MRSNIFRNIRLSDCFNWQSHGKQIICIFTKRFSIKEVTVTSTALANLLKDAGLCESTSEALRMIKQSAVKCDGKVITDKNFAIEKGTAIWQVGKRRFAKVTVEQD